MRKNLRLLLCIPLILIFLFSGWKLFSIWSEYRAGEKNYEDLSQTYLAPKPAEEEFLPSEESEEAGEPLPELTIPEGPLAFTINFEVLIADCPDVVGWLYCPDTRISYPVVQAEDNDYYMYRLPNGEKNKSGSIFMDCRNSSDFSDGHSVLYGHNMKNDSMFGTLQKYWEQEYYDEHPVFYLLTPEQDYRIDLVGGYTTSATAADTYAIPGTPEEQEAMFYKAKRYSTFRSDTKVLEGERLITLSTCAYEYDDARYVLLGVLREWEE